MPRVLSAANSLCGLITDAWVSPQNPLGITSRMRERFHPDLATAPVHSWNLATAAFELNARIHKMTGWSLMIQRNQWFQQRAIFELDRICGNLKGEDVTLFAYSYAAYGLLKFARARGWRTVLGQIDPGPVTERVAKQLTTEALGKVEDHRFAPQPYWDDWQEECALADQIVVNSIWSRDALVSEGIEANKINVVPLAYASPSEAKDFQRCYPETFTVQRPLRVLFLGQVTLLKGILPLLEAARLVEREPIEFQIVGTLHAHLPAEMRNRPNVFWMGGVKRSEVAEYYREADVFVFPSYSDGFGLTQLEAQAWKLPVIASRFCGDVVRDGDNGFLLNELSGKAIADLLLELLHHPNQLRQLSAQSEVGEKFSMNSLASALLSL